MSSATHKMLRHPATSFLGNLFWRPSCLALTATRTTHLWVTTSLLSLNSKHDFCYVYSDAYSAQTFSIDLTVETHILLWHLAANIPSQLHNYFLPPFLRGLQQKGSLYPGCHQSFLKTLRHLRSSPLFSFKYSEEVT